MAERGGLEEKLYCMCGGVAGGGGAQIGSGAKWIGKGERNTGFFLGLEGRHRAGNAVLEMGAGSVQWQVVAELWRKCVTFVGTCVQVNLLGMLIWVLVWMTLGVRGWAMVEKSVATRCLQLANAQMR